MRIFQLIIVSSPQQAKTYQHQDLEATDKSKGSKSSKGFHYLTQTTCACLQLTAELEIFK